MQTYKIFEYALPMHFFNLKHNQKSHKTFLCDITRTSWNGALYKDQTMIKKLWWWMVYQHKRSSFSDAKRH